MARVKRNPKIDSREARLKLAVRHEPYWTQLHSGISLGYRKGKRGGAWIVRRAVPTGYEKKRVATADDHADSDGRTVLSYKQAFMAAVSGDGHAASKSALEITVGEVLDQYMDWHRANSTSAKATEYNVDGRIRPKFGHRRVADLTTKALREWHHGMAKTDSGDPEAVRKKKATANRVLTIFKAALNHAWSEDLLDNADVWRKVKPFRNVDAPRIRFLSTSECRRLLKHCAPDFQLIVRAALLTGCRYGELARLEAQHYDKEAGTVSILRSKTGKARHVPLTDEGIEFFDSVTAGRQPGELIFRRDDGTAWGKSQQFRPMRAACEGAKIDPPISFHILRHTYGSMLARKAVSLQVIAAAMGHADTRMTEKHYAHLQPNYVADQVRKNLPRLDSWSPKVSRIT